MVHCGTPHVAFVRAGTSAAVEPFQSSRAPVDHQVMVTWPAPVRKPAVVDPPVSPPMYEEPPAPL